MPFVQAKCPECGGMLAVDADKKAANCQFCGEAFIVQEAINNYNTYNETINNYNTTHQYGDGAVVNVYENKSKDFVIEAGVLKEYHGESKNVILPDIVTEIAEDCFQNVKIDSIRLSKNLCNIKTLPINVKIDMGENNYFEIINGGFYSQEKKILKANSCNDKPYEENGRVLYFLTEYITDFTLDISTVSISPVAKSFLEHCQHLYFNGTDLFDLSCKDSEIIDKVQSINAPFKITRHYYNENYICEHCGYENVQESFNISMSGGRGTSYCLYFDILPNDTIKISCDDFHGLNYSRSVYSIDIVESISSYRKELLEYISESKHIQIASMNIKRNKIDYVHFSGFASAEKQLGKVFGLFKNVEDVIVMCDSIYKIETYDGEDKGIAVPFWNFEIMKSIKNIKFYDCCVNQRFKVPTSIENVYLSKNMVELSNGMFADCKNIKQITVPPSVVTIDDRCFINCTSLTSITIPETIKKIGRECFKNCVSLTSIVIHKKIESIGREAFMGCKSLKEVLLESPQKEYIEVFDSVFRGCDSIVSITLPKAYGLSCDIFADCINLEKVVVERVPIDYVTKYIFIPANAFKGCKKLKVVETDEQIEYVKEDAFYDCDSLTSINISKELRGDKNSLPKLWKDAGRCSYCGGKFSLFGNCKICGKKRDY